MRVVLFAIMGAIGGLTAGALGHLTGIAWMNIFEPSDFEGYAATMVFFAFTPIGAMAGGLVGAVWAGTVASRARLRMKSDLIDGDDPFLSIVNGWLPFGQHLRFSHLCDAITTVVQRPQNTYSNFQRWEFQHSGTASVTTPHRHLLFC